MDLTLNSSVDIYQIHRTPFFRKLHRNNSEQFERLKKAYENIRSFDETPLKRQVNKVRLLKLLQSIKDSLTKSKLVNENKSRHNTKSKPQIRSEELTKVRQMGNEYSLQNSNFNTTPRMIDQNPLTPKEEWLMRKSQLKRRLDYGNQRSEQNRSKIQRTQAQYSSNGDEKLFPSFPRAPTLIREKLRKLLVRYLTEDKTNPNVVRSLEEIAKTRNHMYWDLMGAIRKQQQYIKRYGNFTKRLSNFAIRTVENELNHKEIFNSKTNIIPCGSEICIRTYRYSDEDEYLPLPTESLLRMPLIDLPDEIPTRDELNNLMEELNENNSIKHLHITLSNQVSSQRHHLVQNVSEKKFDLSNKFGEIIRKTVRKESTNVLTNLEKAMKH